MSILETKNQKLEPRMNADEEGDELGEKVIGCAYVLGISLGTFYVQTFLTFSFPLFQIALK